MHETLQNYLFAKYPLLFQDRHKPPTETCMCWGIGCDNGWVLLLDDLCDNIQQYLKWSHHVPQVVFGQVKEKFGTLRIYYHGGDDFVRGLIDSAEHLSLHICQKCGKFDSNVTKTSINDGWIQTLCENCVPDKKKLGWKNNLDPILTDLLINISKKPMES
jgi:hypothetical protein